MMEVILRDDVKSLGKAGQMVRVRPGFARNYLLPQGLAYEATEGNKKRIVAETRARSTRLAAERSGVRAQNERTFRSDAERLSLRRMRIALGANARAIGSAAGLRVARALKP